MKNLKFYSIAAMTTICLTCVSCLVISINPLYMEKELLTINEFEGEWISSHSIWAIEAAENKSYTLTYKECNDPLNNPSAYSSCTLAEFKVHFTKIDNNFYANFYPTDYLNSENQLMFMHTMAFNSFAKIKLNGDELEIYFLDKMWLNDYLENSPDELDHARNKQGVILTADTKELRQFVSRHASNEDSFHDPIVLKKRTYTTE